MAELSKPMFKPFVLTPRYARKSILIASQELSFAFSVNITLHTNA